MDDLHSAAANNRQLHQVYVLELIAASNEKREPVPPRLKLDASSRDQIKKARERRERRAAKRAARTNASK